MTETATIALVVTVPKEVTSMMGEIDVAVIMKRATEEAKGTRMPRSPKNHRIKSKREEAAPAPRKRLKTMVEMIAKITMRKSMEDTLTKVLEVIIRTKISSARGKTSIAMRRIEIVTMVKVVIKGSMGRKIATVMRGTTTMIGTVTDATTYPKRTGARQGELPLTREVEMKGREIETVTTKDSLRRGVRLLTRMINTRVETNAKRKGKIYARTKAASLITSRSKATTTTREIKTVTMIVVEREDTQGLHLHLVIEAERVMTNSKRKAGTIILTGKRMTTKSHQNPTDKEVIEDAHAVAATRSARTSPLQSSKARVRELHSSRLRSQAAGTSVAGAITSRRATREVGVKVVVMVVVKEQLRQSKDN